ncbi:MAG: hypothetical protein A6D91_05370 [Bacillaceae bacterium G1]|nr:cysteine desulfurase [Bacillota bacterium]OJF16757.1 MAG: hypothetical protein A6D91_05370 [Bacillaceae bacterium G1]
MELQEETKLKQIREQLPAASSQIFLNTGTAGPLPRPVQQAMAQVEERDLTEGRASHAGFRQLAQEMALTRRRLAELLGATPDELAFTHHTTEGINIILWGMNLQPGDEIVTTNLEHSGMLLPLAQIARRRGVTVRYVDAGVGEPEQTLEAIRRALSPRTRLLALSHISYSTGALLPLQEIVELAHQLGVPVLADGAQAVGAIPVHLRNLKVDFYAFPGQKWLCGPEGTGGLYIRRDRLAEIEPTFVGYRSMIHFDRLSPYALPSAGAQRFEVGTLYRPGIAGLNAAIQWLTESVGTAWAYARIRTIVQFARRRLSDIAGLEFLTPENDAGLLTFQIKNIPSDQFVAYAAQHGVILRSIPDNGALRISCGFFNTEEDIETLAELLEKYQEE